MSDPVDQMAWAERRVRDELTAALGRAVDRPADQPLPPLPAPVAEGSGQPLDAFGRPITFNATMVRAILAGNKSQTRRPIKPAPEGAMPRGRRMWPCDGEGRPCECRLACIGEPLWVREPWMPARDPTRRKQGIEYEADFGPAAAKQRGPWRSGRFLPREQSRLTLHVKAIYPQRLGELTPQEAIAEGMSPMLLEEDPAAAIDAFRKLWDKIYADGEFAWDQGPWVWVVRFKAVTPDERLD